MNRDLNKNERDQIESIIDATSVKALLEALSDICGAKSEHVACNWQDATTARVWAYAAGVAGVASTDVNV